MLRLAQCAILACIVEVAFAGVTAGNSGTRGGSYNSGSAPGVTRRAGFSLDDSIERDAHGVYGFMCQSSALSGKVFQVGKCAGAGGADTTDACGILFNADGTKAWQWTPSNPGTDFMNGAAEAPDGSYLLAFGHVGQHRTVYKLDPASGNTVYVYRFTEYTNSAFEFGFFGKDGNVYLAGLANAEAESTWSFKSSGNVDGGQALWQKITAAEIAANTLPAAKVQLHEDLYSLKNMKEADTGFVAIGASETAQVLIKLNADGTKAWATTCSDCGEMTGVATSQDGTEFATVGHCSYDISNTDFTGCSGGGEGSSWTGIDGTVSYFNSQGVKQWTKRYPTPQASVTLITGTDQRVIYEECWSIESTLDGGFVLGCGSGTHCNDVVSQWQATCNTAQMEQWQSLVTKLSADGTLMWQRVDTEGTESETGVENACEYVTQNLDGSFLVTHDNTNGMGYSLLSGTDSPSSTQTTTEEDGGDDGATINAGSTSCAMSASLITFVMQASVFKYMCA